MNQELRKHIIAMLDKGMRLDGRGPLDYRQPIKVEYDYSHSAEGSARVIIGETEIITGVKMALETPYPDTPDSGNLMVGAELSPLASPDFELGPPGIDAIELGRVVDRGIRESKLIDTKKLCIEPGEKVWSLAIDICPINDAGNLFDAGALSALAALKASKFPKLDEDKVDYNEKTENAVPIADSEPLSVTVVKIGPHFIVDPTTEEQKVIDARLTVATTKDGQLCAMQKGGDDPLSVEDIDKMVEIAQDKCNELRKAL